MELNVSRACRVCLDEQVTNSRLVNIFSPCRGLRGGESRTVSDLLAVCTDTQVCEHDHLPKNMCKKCIKDLCTAYNFKVRCEESYKYMVSLSFGIENKEVKLENKSDVPHEVKEEEDDLENASGYMENEEKMDGGGLENKHVVKIENELSLTEESIRTMVAVAADTDYKYIDDLYLKTTLAKSVGFNAKRREKKTSKVNNKICKRHKNDDDEIKKVKKSSIVTNGSGWECNICPKIFRYQYMLKCHEKSHYSMKNYFCKICAKYYTSETLHKKFHLSTKKFSCDICKKFFPTKQKITNHIKVHSQTRERKFKCNVKGCDKSYMALAGLQRHQLTHEGTKNFLCHLCSKSFIDKYGLKVHISHKHIKVRKYQCNSCPKTFVTNKARNVHEKRHLNIKQHQCNICERRFFDKSHLSRHMGIHVQDMKYYCRFCAKRFLRSDNLRRHEVVLHGVQLERTDDDIT